MATSDKPHISKNWCRIRNVAADLLYLKNGKWWRFLLQQSGVYNL